FQCDANGGGRGGPGNTKKGRGQGSQATQDVKDPRLNTELRFPQLTTEERDQPGSTTATRNTCKPISQLAGATCSRDGNDDSRERRKSASVGTITIPAEIASGLRYTPARSRNGITRRRTTRGMVISSSIVTPSRPSPRAIARVCQTPTAMAATIRGKTAVTNGPATPGRGVRRLRPGAVFGFIESDCISVRRHDPSPSAIDSW